MTKLDVFLDRQMAGVLEHNPAENRFAFSYSPQWLNNLQRYPLSPHLPLVPDLDQTPEAHSAAVRHFFENLLPEGRALDEAAAASKVSKSNLVGLMIALGRETAGALALHLSRGDDTGTAANRSLLHARAERRQLSKGELSDRIKARPYEPFSVWDGKVRLSIAGYQDKVAVFKESGEWFLVEGNEFASTTILKPEPLNSNLAGLTSNEFFCMRLAKNIGLPIATVRLTHVPEPVLEVDRFDRAVEGDMVRRLHVIDGCQALGYPPTLKYERPYGDNPHVKDIRDGVSLPQLFDMLRNCPNPAAQRLQLLRWTILQVLIGNTDAHAKNLSFFNDGDGIRLTPAYDLVSILAFADEKIEGSFAMAIGDAFTEAELTPYEWAHFAHLCGLRPQLISREMGKISTGLLQALPRTQREVILERADASMVERVCATVTRLAERHLSIASEITSVDPVLFV
ncbi:MAG TPA: HipA domain-containing protein [Noviherbaspirillum sp.]|uniref:HipA domain-containing protein n=1 Tax=Noviherbaspirillum sp. TaxID=1926288 RepID=UPI002D54F085|nr:HipA domain-containing protein [Noviherbaspirillum sp.]HYD93822.1 HipA domain-containing protein [Noviherbaspirillum sp.]